MKMRRAGAGVGAALLLTMLAVLPVAAAEKAVNLSLFTPISLAKAEDSVTGFRFNLIYGKNASVRVVDLGFINHTTTGLSKGLQWGAVNVTEGEFSGLQIAAININKGSAHGVQWGTVNYAATAGGLQLAFVNYAQTIDGLQIGAINIIKKGGFLPVCIIANWSK
jgi:hypothetical protein